MARESKAQQETVGRVMHEFRHGELKRGRGGKVKNPRQAIAIALSEAGASKYQPPGKTGNRWHAPGRRSGTGGTAQQAQEGRMGASRRPVPAHTGRAASQSHRGTCRTQTRRDGGATRAELYREATRRGVPGRSRMRKAELERALRR